jgi:hypothetical protein
VTSSLFKKCSIDRGYQVHFCSQLKVQMTFIQFITTFEYATMLATFVSAALHDVRPLGIPLPEVMSGLLKFVCRARFKSFSINPFFPAGGVVFLVGAGVSSLEPLLKMKPTHTRCCHWNRLWVSWGMVNCCAGRSVFLTCRHWLLHNY